MKKGNLGIRLAAYGVIAFILSYVGSSTLLFLVLGVALLVEKNEWAVRQVIQAIVLCYIATIIRSIIGIFNFIDAIPVIGAIWDGLTGIVYSLIDLVVLACAVVGVMKNLKDEEADIPVARKVADWVYGVAAEKAAPVKEVEKKEEAVSEQKEQ